ncbi:MAG: hypothetical protein GY771_14055 [bacterium]|nr:hypothetical protein [bacterium]
MSNWKSRKLWVTLFAYGAIIVGFVFGFIDGSSEVMLACIGVTGLITGAYNAANAWQSRGMNGNGNG